MAESWQQAWVEVLPDLSTFRQKTNSAIVPMLSSAGDQGGRRLGTSMGAVFAGSFFGSILANLGSRIVASITGGIRTGIEAGINFIQASVVEASDLNESVNALNVSFGEASEGIQGLGRDAATSLALSNVEFNALAVRFSAFGRQIVGEGGDVTGFIDELTTRGADFASVYNIEVAEALTLFQSGLAGETEPLRRYGIDLSAATVAGYAYANGIAEQGKQLTQQQKVQAAYAALLDQTSVTQGDFANTSGELANQQRILAARFADSQARLGTALLPALTSLANLANEELIPVLDDVIAEVGPVLAEALRESVPMLRDFALAMAPLIPDLVKLAVSALPPLVQLLIVLTPLIEEWAAQWTTISQITKGFFELLNGDTTLQQFSNDVYSSGSVVVQFALQVGSALNDAIMWFHNLRANVAADVNSVVSFVSGIPGQIGRIFSGLGSLLVGSGRALIQGFINGINQMLRPVRAAINGVMSLVSGFFPKSPAQYGPFSGSGWDSVRRSGGALFEQFNSGFGGELGGVAIAGATLRVPSAVRVSGGSAGGVAALPPVVVSVQPRGGIDLLKYIDVQVEGYGGSTAVDVNAGGLA